MTGTAPLNQIAKDRQAVIDGANAKTSEQILIGTIEQQRKLIYDLQHEVRNKTSAAIGMEHLADRYKAECERLRVEVAALRAVAAALIKLDIPVCTCHKTYLMRDMIDPGCQYCDQKFAWMEISDAIRAAGYLPEEARP